MTNVLQDIWILTDSGTVIWSRVFNPKMDKQLFGALMSAINTFAMEIGKEGLTNIQLTDKSFFIFKKKELLFITNAPNKVKEKRVKHELKWIADKFFELYSEELKIWDRNTLIFSDFKNHIENSLEKPIDKLKKSFW
jgi:hypothetical protein